MNLKFGLNLNQVDFLRKLYHQPSGTIHRYKKSSKESKFVVKRSMAKSFEEFLNKLNPVILGFGHDHESILPIYGFHLKYGESENPQHWYIDVKVPIIKETLRDKIDLMQESKTILPEEEIVKYISSLTCGLGYLHSKKIPHGDLNPDNIVFDIDGNIKIMGMGNFIVSEDQIPDENFSDHGFYLYSAPELHDRKKERKRKDLIMGDLWALGIIMAQLCSVDVRSIDFSATEGELAKQFDSKFEKLEMYSEKLKTLMKSLLKFNPEERIELKNTKSVLNVQENNTNNYLKEFRKSKEEDKEEVEGYKRQIDFLQDLLKKRNQEIEEMTQRYISAMNEYEKANKRNKELEQLLGPK